MDGLRKMRNLVKGDDALPSLALAHVIEDRHGSGRLYDPTVAGEVRRHRGHASLHHAAVLGTVGAIQSSGVVERRLFLVERRGWSVLASRAGRIVVFAGFTGLQQ